MQTREASDVVSRLARFYAEPGNLAVDFQLDRQFATVEIRKVSTRGSITRDGDGAVELRLETPAGDMRLRFAGGEVLTMEGGAWRGRDCLESTIGAAVAESGGAGLALLALLLGRDDFFLENRFHKVRELRGLEVFQTGNGAKFTRLFVAKGRPCLTRTSQSHPIEGGRVRMVTRYTPRARLDN